MDHTEKETVELVKSFEELTRAWPSGVSLFSIQGQGKVLVVSDADGEVLLKSMYYYITL